MFSPVSKPILASTHVATPFQDLQDVHILVSVCKLKAFAIFDKLPDEIVTGFYQKLPIIIMNYYQLFTEVVKPLVLQYCRQNVTRLSLTKLTNVSVF